MKKVILFGAGNALRDTINYLNQTNIVIQAICDNDFKKWGKIIYGYRVISPKDISEVDFDYIIISNKLYFEEIKKQLYSLDIKKVLPLYSERLNYKEKKMYNFSVNIYGKICIYIMNLRKKQDFFPTLAGMWFNPYFHVRRELAKFLCENKNYISGRCMDFGCGNKPYERLFNTVEYIGVEIEGENKKDGIVYYDGHTIPFEDSYFDSIISSQVFEHVSNLDEIICELRRVLKTGGYMLITVPFTYPEHLVPYDFWRFSSFGIKKYLEENGFETVQYNKSGNFIETIYQMKNVYINEELFSKKTKFIFLKKLMCFTTNFKGLILSQILPESYNSYLDNVIVVRKK